MVNERRFSWFQDLFSSGRGRSWLGTWASTPALSSLPPARNALVARYGTMGENANIPSRLEELNKTCLF